MSDYPILVERYTGMQSMTIVCTTCGTEEVIGVDDLVCDELYRCPRNVGQPIVAWDERHKLPCPGHAVHKYLEADHRCGGCGALGFFPEDLGRCCSRRCQLQAEYAKTLKDAA